LNIVSTLVLLVFTFSCGGLSLLILYFDPVWQYTRKRREFIRLEDDGIRFDTLTSGKRFLRWEHIRNAKVLCYRSGKGSLLELFLYIEHDARRYGSNRIITAETCLDLLLITPSYPFTCQCDTAYALPKSSAAAPPTPPPNTMRPSEKRQNGFWLRRNCVLTLLKLRFQTASAAV
jgi:hypothetical protein